MDLMMWNNSLSLPLLLALGVVLDNPFGLLEALPEVSRSGWFAINASFLVAGLIAFSGFLLQAAVSPTTATVVNHLTKVCTFVASAILFKDTFGFSMLVGAVLTLAGTVWYSHESTRKNPAASPPSGAPPESPQRASGVAGGPAGKGGCNGLKAPNEETSLLSGAPPAARNGSHV